MNGSEVFLKRRAIQPLRTRLNDKEKAEKTEPAKQHTAIEDTVDNTAVTSNDNQSDDSNN